MLMIAERGGEPTVHEGRRGLKAHLNLTRVVQSLTVNHGENDRKVLARMVSQVFRRTGSAVCLAQADPRTKADPVWFVAETLPENLIVVVGYVRGKSAESMSRPPSAFNEDLFLRSGERKLRPEEVGETLPAGEVTVTTTAQPDRKKRRSPTLTDEQKRRRAQSLEPFHELSRKRRAELTEQVYEFVATAPVPMSHPELSTLFNQEMGTDWHPTTIRTVLMDLHAAGRLAYHEETKAERVVRGGGKSPKARGPRIWHLPGEDAPRTRLPDGIEPVRSGQDWATEQKEERQSLADRVYAVMDVPNRPDTKQYAPRSLGQICKAADVSPDTAQRVLNALVAAGRVFYHPKHNYWSPMSRVTSTTLARYGPGAKQPAPAEAAAAPAQPIMQPEQLVQEAGLPIDRRTTAGRAIDLVLQLANETGNGHAAAEVKALQAENARLRTEVQKLEQAVAGLKMTLTALS